ncbi:MAG: dCTP deaminase [Myxococcales bacterium FL481]|nr:MAG: dCTP deaminase [Myxococcales bacterium FL481]
MILSDRDLKARLEKGDLVVDSIIDPDLQIQPSSIDLRLGNTFVVYKLPHVACIDARDAKSVETYTETIEIPDGEGFVLQPGAFALGATAEIVRIPADLVARVEGRSSIGRIAVVVHATAGFIDPGFEGRITLELSNLGRCAVKLYPGMRISQIVLHTMTSPAERPYGAGRHSKYQGQMGPVASRIGRDR